MGSGTSKVGTENSSKNDDPENKALVHEGWKDIREKKRRCTDCLCLVLLLLCWAAMTFVGLAVTGVIQYSQLKTGNPNRLIHATDYQGHICGVDSPVQHKPYAYYMIDRTVVCISSCPSSTNTNTGICKYDVSSGTTSSSPYFASNVAEGNCMIQLASTAVLNRCVPKLAVSAIDSMISNTTSSSSLSFGLPSSSSGWFGSFLGDVYNLQGYIFGFGIGVAVGLAFLYLYVLRIPGFLFICIWGILFSVFAALVVGSILLYSLSVSWNGDGKHTHYQVVGMKGLSYAGFAICFLYACLMVVLRKRIQLAIGVVKEAARAMASMPLIIFLPIFQTLAICVFLVPWIIYVLYLASSGDSKLVTGTGSYVTASGTQTYTYSYHQFTYDTNTKYAFIYMAFCWFWSSEFIVAIGQLVVALSFVSWYFTKDKKNVGNSNVLWAMKATTIYHLGTAAFGSLVLAIVLTIRAVLAYLQKQAKKQKNKLLEYVLCIVQCCMWLLEKVLRFLNKNAYIQTAIYGYSFCKAARSAFFLILRNILRVSAVNIVADFVLLLGKLFVPSLTVFLCYLALAYTVSSSDINGLVSPLIFVGLLSYFVALNFAEIFGMGIETVLLCYVADEEMFSPADRFADGPLKTTLEKTAQAAASGKVEPEATENPAASGNTNNGNGVLL